MWTGKAGFCLGRFEAEGILLVCGCRRVYCQPWRWHFVEFSIASRYFLDRHSLLFRSFFACSSFGPRSVFDRLTTKQRETNEDLTRTEREAIEKPWAVCRDLMAWKFVVFVNISSIFSCWDICLILGLKVSFLFLEIILGLNHKDTTWHPRNARVLAVLIKHLILFNFIIDIFVFLTRIVEFHSSYLLLVDYQCYTL